MSELMIAANTANTTANAAGTQTAAGAANAEVKQNVQTAAKDAKAAAQTPVQGKAVEEVPASPETTGQEQGSPWLSMLPFILIFVVMIFFMNRSQKKQMQKRQEMMDKIAKGTKVLLASGIYGTVDAVHDDFMIVEIASGVKVKVSKNGIANIDAPEEAAKKVEGK